MVPVDPFGGAVVLLEVPATLCVEHGMEATIAEDSLWACSVALFPDNYIASPSLASSRLGQKCF